MKNFNSLEDIKEEIRRAELKKAITAEKLKLNYKLAKQQFSIGRLTEDLGVHLGQKIAKSVVEKI